MYQDYYFCFFKRSPIMSNTAKYQLRLYLKLNYRLLHNTQKYRSYKNAILNIIFIRIKVN